MNQKHTNVVEATREYDNYLALANATQLGVDVLREIAGNDIATGIGSGDEQTPVMSEAELTHSMAAKIQTHLFSE